MNPFPVGNKSILPYKSSRPCKKPEYYRLPNLQGFQNLVGLNHKIPNVVKDKILPFEGQDFNEKIKKHETNTLYFTSSFFTIPSDVFTRYIPAGILEVSIVRASLADKISLPL
jgi:hypothetical protein